MSTCLFKLEAEEPIDSYRFAHFRHSVPVHLKVRVVVPAQQLIVRIVG